MIFDLKKIECITLFVEDLALVRSFYENIFDLKIVFEDKVSAVLKIDTLMINLLQITEAAQLIEPAQVDYQSNWSRFMFTILVKNVDSVCEQLRIHNVVLLNGPINRPWGRRTAAFLDPAGNAWEVAQEILG